MLADLAQSLDGFCDFNTSMSLFWETTNMSFSFVLWLIQEHDKPCEIYIYDKQLNVFLIIKWDMIIMWVNCFVNQGIANQVIKSIFEVFKYSA